MSEAMTPETPADLEKWATEAEINACIDEDEAWLSAAAIARALIAEQAAHAETRERLATQHEPIADTYACQQCGRRDGLDAVVPSDVWVKLEARTGCNLLCLWCIDALAGEIGWAGSASLHFAGQHITGTSQSAADRDHISRVCRERDAAEAKAAEALQALALILPLAKGYAAAHPVGSNALYVEHAAALSAEAVGVCQKSPDTNHAWKPWGALKSKCAFCGEISNKSVIELRALSAEADQGEAVARELRIVFDGPPGPEAGRFVEVENADGRSINAGEWRQRDDGLWELVING